MKHSIKIEIEKPSLENAFKDFIVYKKSLKKADETIKYYERCFHSFSKLYDVDKRL